MISFWPLDLQNINELMIIKVRVGFEWTKTDVTSFCLPCLAVLTIKEFQDGTIGWLCNNTNLFCFDALDGVALDFIAWVTANPVAICRKSMDKKLYK